MFVYWPIRYLDTRDRQFKDRRLYLVTTELDPLTQAAVETCLETKRTFTGREILRYRHLFRACPESDAEVDALWKAHGGMRSVCLYEYFEDQDGKEMSPNALATALTGNPHAELLPSGLKQHDLDFRYSKPEPVRFESMSATTDELEVLGYFVRDLKQLRASTVFKDGPGTLQFAGGPVELSTVATEAEIGAFVATFRRLYMTTEPAGFLKAVDVACKLLAGHPLAKWIRGVADEYSDSLGKPPDSVPLDLPKPLEFDTKRLIDVFLYTQYAHQPDERRSRQYEQCLKAVRNEPAILSFLFLTEMWHCSHTMSSAGKQIAWLFDRYCQHHGAECKVVKPMAAQNPKIGTLESREAQRERVLQTKASELAKALWKEAGEPAGGHTAFLSEARTALEQHLAASASPQQPPRGGAGETGTDDGTRSDHERESNSK
jgi:hypothetical protein